MLRTDLNSTRSELQVADSDFQNSLSVVNTALETRVSQSLGFSLCMFFKNCFLVCLFVCLPFVSLLQTS